MSADDDNVDPGRLITELAQHYARPPEHGSELSDVTAAVLAAVPAAAHAGVSRTDSAGRITSLASTHTVVDTLDLLQDRYRYGPSIAPRENPVVTIADTGADTRWPRFAAAAARVGIASILSLPLNTGDDGDTTAALSLYATGVGALTADDETVAAIFAQQAADILAGVDQRRHLIETVAAHGVVGRATGLVIARHDVTAPQACELLADAAASIGCTISNLAQRLVEDAEYPTLRAQATA